jgi:plasmid stabilization system protein ParE
MTLKVVFRPAARAEFDGATLWYEDRRPGLGAQFVSEIDYAVEHASKYPDRYPIKHKEIRSVRARRFPYSIYYIAEAEQIVVLAVFHAWRNPAIWRSRA